MRLSNNSNRPMNYSIDKSMQFPLVNINLDTGERVFIQSGSMVYHDTSVDLSTHLNGKGHGLHKLFSAVGRSFTSGENMLITQAEAQDRHGTIALAPNVPGEILPLELGQDQYRINDGAFLAMDGASSYSMKLQSVSKALFSGTGGFYVMTTSGSGIVLCNAYGSIREIDLDNSEITIDNNHVVAWSTSLDYDIHLENGLFQSFGTGEGIVNTFKGTGKVYIQSLNLESFAESLMPFLTNKDN